MPEGSLQRVEVMRIGAGNRDFPFGPLPALRDGNALAYEFELPERFETWPGRTHLERTFVLLDVGVSFSDPPWRAVTHPDGSVSDVSAMGPGTWYVDLVSVRSDGERYTISDQFIDVMIPTDGRHYRLLDLDDYADAMDRGELTPAEAAEGLRRWQQFLDRYVHADRYPSDRWSDFPPTAIRRLADAPAPIGEPVALDAFEQALEAHRASHAT